MMICTHSSIAKLQVSRKKSGRVFLMEITPLPCPFCGHEKIRVLESTQGEARFEGGDYVYSWCHMCRSRGPLAYSVDDPCDVSHEWAVRRWNERGGVKQDGK